MLFFIYGDNIYFAKRKLREIVNKYAQVDTAIKNFDCRNDNVAALNEELSQQPLLYKKRLFVFLNALSAPVFKSFALQNEDMWLSLRDSAVFFEEGNPNKKDKLFLFLKKTAKIQEFKQPSKSAVYAFVTNEFKRYGTQIDAQALAYLANNYNDLWLLENEIKKIAAWGNGAKIGLKDVVSLCWPSAQFVIFEALDAIGTKNKSRAIEILRDFILRGENAAYLLSMLAFQFRNLILVKDLQERGTISPRIAKETSLHPYVLRKIIDQAQGFQLEELKKFYHKLFEADLKIKNGDLEPATAIDFLISGI